MSHAGFDTKQVTCVETASTTRARSKAEESQAKRRRRARWSATTVTAESAHPMKVTSQEESAKANIKRQRQEQ